LVIPIDLGPLRTVGGDLIKPRKFGVQKQVFGGFRQDALAEEALNRIARQQLVA
jgi:hypothetical protein